MITQSSDTNQKTEDIQISLIRQASIAERISRTRSLSQTVIQLSRRAIRRANSELTEKELILEFVSYHYGSKLASNLREYLNKCDLNYEKT